MPDCFDPIAQFYINVIILDNGSVALLNLECVKESESCYITVDDLLKLENSELKKQIDILKDIQSKCKKQQSQLLSL